MTGEDDFVMVRFGWDGGPYGTYEVVPEATKERTLGQPVLRVPKSLWGAYASARDALAEAEEALDAWEIERLAALRVSE